MADTGYAALGNFNQTIPHYCYPAAAGPDQTMKKSDLADSTGCWLQLGSSCQLAPQVPHTTSHMGDSALYSSCAGFTRCPQPQPTASAAAGQQSLYKHFKSSHLSRLAGGVEYACRTSVGDDSTSGSAPGSGGSSHTCMQVAASVSPSQPFQHVWNSKAVAAAGGSSMDRNPTRFSSSSFKHSTSAAAEESDDLECFEDMAGPYHEDMLLCDMRDSQDCSFLPGSASVRLHIADVSIYTDATGPEALRIANAIMCKIKLPGGIVYIPVHNESLLQQAGAAWSFPAMTVCLASSYFQRLLANRHQLAAAAQKVPSMFQYVQPLPAAAEPSVQLPEMDVRHLQNTLRSILFTCLFLAVKVADQLHARGLLTFMLTAIAGNIPVSQEEALEVEARCLDGLEWRMGPYFLEDDLIGDDVDLWLGAWQM